MTSLHLQPNMNLNIFLSVHWAESYLKLVSFYHLCDYLEKWGRSTKTQTTKAVMKAVSARKGRFQTSMKYSDTRERFCLWSCFFQADHSISHDKVLKVFLYFFCFAFLIFCFLDHTISKSFITSSTEIWNTVLNVNISQLMWKIIQNNRIF